MLINSSHEVECILDPVCQIIAMSKAICHKLGLAYDPCIVLHMQSANGNLDQSLGLACNIPFQIGAITMYLQVHVISSPTYNVLLGRPFDVLTKSVVSVTFSLLLPYLTLSSLLTHHLLILFTQRLLIHD